MWHFLLLFLQVRVYSIATKYCPNAEAREELVHLFRGCGETCCLSGITVPTPESATMATASGSGILTMSSQSSPCFPDIRVPSSDDPDSISTSSGSHSDVTNTSSATSIPVVQIKGTYVVSVVCTGIKSNPWFVLIAGSSGGGGGNEICSVVGNPCAPHPLNKPL